MYVDTTALEVRDRSATNEIVRAIREALHPFESRLRRIQVEVRCSDERHVCRLRVWWERGHTIVIESCATSRPEAIAMATDSLTRTLDRRWKPHRVGSPPREGRPGLKEARSPDRRLQGTIEDLEQPEPEPDGVLTEPRAGRVLLALHELDPTSASLHWARVLAEALENDLEVCRVLSDLAATASLPPGQSWLSATRRLLAATREARHWCRAVLPDAELFEPVISGASDLVRDTALLARQRNANWVVMPAGHAGCGASAVALARAAGCPVLVARAPTSRSTLLVATNGGEDTYPILTQAAVLAEALHAPVLAFHDVGTSPSTYISQVDALTNPWARIQSVRLSASGQRRLPEIDVFLAHGSDRVETLLQQARREDAEIILVGVAEVASPHADDQLAAVVDRAIRSVLLVPSLDDPGHDEPFDTSSAGREPRRMSSPTLGVADRRRWRGTRAKIQPTSDRRRGRSG